MGSITIWHWLGFGALIAFLLAADLGLFHRKSKSVSLRAAAITTVCWCLFALAFAFYIWKYLGDPKVPGSGGTKSIEFLTGYITEWALSMDNVFVFAIVFKYFHVPPKYQHRVLFWGILGAVFMRLTFVLAGAALIHQFHFVIALLGLFLIYTGIKLALSREGDIHPERTWALRFARRFLRVAGGHYDTRKPGSVPGGVMANSAAVASGPSMPEVVIDANDEPSPEEMEAAIAVAEQQQLDDAHMQADLEHPATGDRFLVRHKGKWCVTPLFLVLLVVETTDVLFAVDSVPAIFGITTDPFIVFTSNIFAILGLRALYFLLAGVMDLFHYLKYGLALILAFIGCKMVADYLAELIAEKYYNVKDFELIPVWASLAVIGAILAISVAASLLAKRGQRHGHVTGGESAAGASPPGEG